MAEYDALAIIFRRWLYTLHCPSVSTDTIAHEASTIISKLLLSSHFRRYFHRHAGRLRRVDSIHVVGFFSLRYSCRQNSIDGSCPSFPIPWIQPLPPLKKLPRCAMRGMFSQDFYNTPAYAPPPPVNTCSAFTKQKYRHSKSRHTNVTLGHQYVNNYHAVYCYFLYDYGLLFCHRWKGHWPIIRKIPQNTFFICLSITRSFLYIHQCKHFHTP